jgi:hypothetical protein
MGKPPTSLPTRGERSLRRLVGRTRAWAASAVVVGVAVSLAACGSSGSASPKAPTTSSPRLVLTAYAQTISGKTAKMALSERVSQSTANSQPKQVTISGTGSIDFTTGNGGLAFTSSATGAYADRFISPILYLQLPPVDSSQLPAGKTWVSVNINAVSEAKLGQSLAQLSDSSQQPTQILSYLQGVSRTGITTIGPATIRGVATTAYKGTVDLTKLADQKGSAQGAALKSVEAQLHTTTLPIQVWIDAQGRARRVSAQFQGSTTSQSGPGTTVPSTSASATVTIDYFDFGTPVTVVPPPAAQVEDVTSQALAATPSTSPSGG